MLNLRLVLLGVCMVSALFYLYEGFMHSNNPQNHQGGYRLNKDTVDQVAMHTDTKRRVEVLEGAVESLGNRLDELLKDAMERIRVLSDRLTEYADASTP